MRISSLLKTKRHKKKKVTVKLNPRQVTSLKKQRELLKNGYNTKFLAEVQPQGGITFADNYAIASDGYAACLSVIHYPNDPLLLWLTQARVITLLFICLCKINSLNQWHYQSQSKKRI
ncbi:MAG: hypothetical protein N4R73_04875 [Lactobacillus crispatus]|nr:hypothetical protein [Lactobacillus crispatus]